MKTYFLTSSLRRNSPIWADASAIVDQVNRRAGAGGISTDRDAVQALLDECASADDQALMEIKIEFEEAQIDG